MALFSRGPTAVIGVDISASSVKLVELGRRGDKYRMEAYAIVPLPADSISDKNIVNIDAVSDTISKAIKKAGTKVQHVACAVSGASVITKVVQLPAGLTGSDMETQVEVAAEQYIPFALDEVHKDFEIIGPAEDPEQVDVLIAACRNDNIDNRVAALEQAGLIPKIVDVEALVLENAITMMLEHELGEEAEEQVVAVADIGGSSTVFSVLENSRVVFSREEAFGGNQLTDQIQQSYGLSPQEADMAKRQGGLPDDYEENVLTPFRQELAQQIERVVQFLFSSSHISAIDRFLLAGGCAAIPDVASTVEDVLKIPSIIANPFANMHIASKIGKQQLSQDAPSLLTACGLALRSFD